MKAIQTFRLDSENGKLRKINHFKKIKYTDIQQTQTALKNAVLNYPKMGVNFCKKLLSCEFSGPGVDDLPPTGPDQTEKGISWGALEHAPEKKKEKKEKGS